MFSGVLTFSLDQIRGVSDLNFRIADNTSFSIQSVALIDFALKPNTPFLVTCQSVEDPIFGYNLIEYLFTSTNDPNIFDILMSPFPRFPSKGAETVASFIQKVAAVPDLLGDVKVIKRTITPSNSIVKVKCKANIELGTKEKSVIFQPLLGPQVEETLEFRESYETIRNERTPHVSVYISSPSNCEIVLEIF